MDEARCAGGGDLGQRVPRVSVSMACPFRVIAPWLGPWLALEIQKVRFFHSFTRIGLKRGRREGGGSLEVRAGGDSRVTPRKTTEHPTRWWDEVDGVEK